MAALEHAALAVILQILHEAISHANLKAALEAEQPDTDAAVWYTLLLP